MFKNRRRSSMRVRWEKFSITDNRNKPAIKPSELIKEPITVEKAEENIKEELEVHIQIETFQEIIENIIP